MCPHKWPCDRNAPAWKQKLLFFFKRRPGHTRAQVLAQTRPTRETRARLGRAAATAPRFKAPHHHPSLASPAPGPAALRIPAAAYLGETERRIHNCRAVGCACASGCAGRRCA